MNMQGLVTLNEAARLKGVSRQAIQAAIKADRLTVVTRKVDRRFIVRTSLDGFIPNPNMKRAGRPKNGSTVRAARRKGRGIE